MLRRIATCFQVAFGYNAILPRGNIGGFPVNARKQEIHANRYLALAKRLSEPPDVRGEALSFLVCGRVGDNMRECFRKFQCSVCSARLLKPSSAGNGLWSGSDICPETITTYSLFLPIVGPESTSTVSESRKRPLPRPLGEHTLAAGSDQQESLTAM